MPGATLQAIVMLVVILMSGAEVLLRVVKLTKARMTRLSLTFYLFWLSCILGYIVPCFPEITMTVYYNLACRLLSILPYPVMYSTSLWLMLSRIRILDVKSKLKDCHHRALLILTVLVSLMTEIERYICELITAGLSNLSYASAVPVVTASTMYFGVLNIFLYGMTLWLLRGNEVGSHTYKIMGVVALTFALDLWPVITTLTGDYVSGYKEEAVVEMLKMRLELEIWEDFLQVVKQRRVGQPSKTNGDVAVRFHTHTRLCYSQCNMSYVNTELIVLMSVHAVVSAEVLRGIVVLTKGRLTRLSVQFYAFWFSAVVGYFVTAYLEMTYPAVGSNYT
ncbi:hypothetical protein RI367_004084 [Sorochytrium milnesiophthora]